jgi:hypothetical protein
MVSGERQCLDRDPGFRCDAQAVLHGAITRASHGLAMTYIARLVVGGIGTAIRLLILT